MAYLMGIDLGTSSVKALIMADDGTIKGLGQREYSIDVPYEGFAEQRPEVWWEATVQAIKEAFNKAAIDACEIKAIGLSGQMHGLVLLDKQHNVLRPAIIWCDQRSKPQIQEIYKRFDKDTLGKLTLNPIATGFQLASLLWVKRNEPYCYQNTYKIILPKDYIRFKLTETIGTDRTDASGTLAFNIAAGEWSRGIIEGLGIDMDKYPIVGNPFDVIGEITDKAARETGLKKGTPVVLGGADQPMQAVGNGIIEPKILSSTIGTGGQVFTLIKQPLYDRELRTHTFCNVLPNTWNIMGASLCSGLSLKWLKDSVFNGMDFKAMDAEAEKIQPGSNGLLFLPYLVGERTPHMDPDAKGIFFGLTLNHTKAHMIRAVMEGVVFALRDSIEIFKSLGITFDKVIASGGGARSKLWLKLQADIFGREVYTTKMIEQACAGAAIMAGIGIGIYSSLEEGCTQVVKLDDKITIPDEQSARVYNEYYPIFRELYIANRALFKKI